MRWSGVRRPASPISVSQEFALKRNPSAETMKEISCRQYTESLPLKEKPELGVHNRQDAAMNETAGKKNCKCVFLQEDTAHG